MFLYVYFSSVLIVLMVFKVAQLMAENQDIIFLNNKIGWKNVTSPGHPSWFHLYLISKILIFLFN